MLNQPIYFSGRARLGLGSWSFSRTCLVMNHSFSAGSRKGPACFVSKFEAYLCRQFLP